VRLRVRVRQGHGGQDRDVPLAELPLARWRAYWPSKRPRPWVCPARHQPPRPTTTLQQTLKGGGRQHGIATDAALHTRRLVALHTFLALGSFVYIVFTNSIGGHITGKPSGFEHLVMMVGIEIRRTFTLPEWVSALLILLGLAGIAWRVLPSRLRRRHPPR
jgi:hypothetical protein